MADEDGDNDNDDEDDEDADSSDSPAINLDCRLFFSFCARLKARF
jgi:hypothetical protein